MYKLHYKDMCTCFSLDQTTNITEYITKKEFVDLSIVLSEINGDHGEFIYHGGMQFYYVIEGNVTFVFNNKQFNLNAGDCIQIFDEWHRKIGNNAKILVVSTPAFERELEEIR